MVGTPFIVADSARAVLPVGQRKSVDPAGVFSLHVEIENLPPLSSPWYDWAGLCSHIKTSTVLEYFEPPEI
jgi:hypothetical protein